MQKERKPRWHSFHFIENFVSTRLELLFILRIITYKMSASPQQQTNEWCRISQLKTWISTIQLVEKSETANWSLRQGDEEVNKRIKQKNIYIYIFNQIAQYFSLKTNLLQGLKEKWTKKKQEKIWKCGNKKNIVYHLVSYTNNDPLLLMSHSNSYL